MADEGDDPWSIADGWREGFAESLLRGQRTLSMERLI
jgi:hypothetical protein